MYQALYRKWRPQTFDQVVGQGHVTETLKNQVKSGRLSHAYIFIGTRGTGKTTCARILAKAVNCHDPVDGNPCGKCPACLGINDGSVLDVVEIDAASNNKVDDVRALREEAVFSPASVKKRVYIIDEVHMLSNSAFNALLKILEEPPEHLMFILATTELQKVPATILSRCQRHSFRRLDSRQIADYLEYIAGQEDFSLSREAAGLIARLADGGVRDALSLLDQCSAYEKIDVEAVYSTMGLAGRRRVAEMLSHILKHNSVEALSSFNAMWMDGKDGAAFLKELADLVRDVMIMRVAPAKGELLTSGGYDEEVLKGFARTMQTAQLISIMETIQRYQTALRDAINPKTTVELCLISLCDDTLGENVNALRGRIARLEEQLASGVVLSAPAAQPVQRAPAYEEAPLPEEPPVEDMPPWDEPYIPAEPAAPAAQPAPVQYPEPVMDEPAADIPTPQPQTGGRSATWAAICERAAENLSPNIRSYFGDESNLTGSVEGNVLKIQADPVFVYSRVNKPAVLNAFAKAASELCGCEIRAQLGELKKEAVQQRDIFDLKQYGEVKFM